MLILQNDKIGKIEDNMTNNSTEEGHCWHLDISPFNHFAEHVIFI